MPLSDVALVLGPVLFQDFEIPDRIGFGGNQRLAVHDMPGGQRVIDALGPTPTDIAWQGIFSGQDATLRARTLDTLRIQAAVLTLSWDVFFYSVVIRSFEATYRNATWVPYQLRVSVLTDAALLAPELIGDLVDDALGDAASAAEFASMSDIDLSMLQTSLSVSGATVLHTGAYLSATVALTSAQTSVQTGLDGADASLGIYASGLSSVADVAGMINAAGNAAALSVSNAYLGRLGANMLNAGT
jgi:hypothetical protein